MPKLKLPKNKDNSNSTLNSRENSLDKKSLLFKKNEDIINNELKKNQILENFYLMKNWINLMKIIKK